MCLGEPKGGDEARGGLGVGSGSDVPKEGVSTSAEGGLPIVGSSFRRSSFFRSNVG